MSSGARKGPKIGCRFVYLDLQQSELIFVIDNYCRACSERGQPPMGLALRVVARGASKLGDPWILNELKRFADDANPGLFRVAFKMATGSGKTVVMGMLIAWQALNKFQSPHAVTPLLPT